MCQTVLVRHDCSGHHFELLLELVAVWVPSDFRCRWDLVTSEWVNTPALTPLAMGGHVALERGKKNTN